MLSLSFTSALLVGLILSTPALAHMEMQTPYAINSKYNSATPQNLIDYSMTSPLDADGSNYPCKGYQNQRPILSSATYTTGESNEVAFAGSATHGGGSCQLSLSYDNGETFRVIMSIIGGCPLEASYNFSIPSYAPSGTALFAWTWFNHVGNREIYMNCAWVDIVAGTTSAKDRRTDTFSSFDDLPYIWKANLPDQNGCATVEAVDPVFPEPGPEVEYGAGLSASSAATSGICNAATPAGATYKDLSTGNDASGDSGSSSSISASPTALSSTAIVPSSTADMSSSIEIQTSTVIVSPISMTSTSTSSALSGMKTIAYTSTSMNAFTSTSISYTVYSTYTSESSATPTSRFTFTNTSVSSTAYSSYTSMAPANQSTSVPSTFLTQASSTSVSSAVLVSSSTIVLASSSAYVAPSITTTTETISATNAPYTSSGGTSSTCDGAAMGSFKCLRSGQGFAVCNWGQWIDMGSVTAGTECTGNAGSAVVCGSSYHDCMKWDSKDGRI